MAKKGQAMGKDETRLALLSEVNDPLAILAGVNGDNAQGYSPEVAAMLADEFADEQDAFDFQPGRLKFPSGGMTAGFPTADGDMQAAPVNAVIMMAQKARAFWPRLSDNDNTGGPPLCSSPNARHGYFNADDAEQVNKAMQLERVHPALPMLDGDIDLSVHGFNCKACPLSKYIDGEMTPCKELRRLLILIEGQRLPVILSVPTASIKSFDQYASRLTGKGKSYFTVVTKLSLRKEKGRRGHDYAKLELEAVGDLTEEQVKAVLKVRDEYGQLVRDIAMEADDYNTEPYEGATVVDGQAEQVPF